MSTEELLAAALHESREDIPWADYTYKRDVRDEARGVLATEAGQALARQAAIGAAVERLATYSDAHVESSWWSISGQPGGSRFEAYCAAKGSGSGHTLLAAIDAALGTEP